MHEKNLVLLELYQHFSLQLNLMLEAKSKKKKNE